MTNPVAKINSATADSLKISVPGLDIQIDLNSNYIINVEEAQVLLSASQYTIIEFEPAYIGAPRPKHRPR